MDAAGDLELKDDKQQLNQQVLHEGSDDSDDEGDFQSVYNTVVSDGNEESKEIQENMENQSALQQELLMKNGQTKHVKLQNQEETKAIG